MVSADGAGGKGTGHGADGAALGDVDWIRAGYEAMNRDGLEGLLPYLHPDVEWRTPTDIPRPAVVHGHDGVRAWDREWRRTWETFRFELDEVVQRDDRVLVLLRCVGRLRTLGVEVSQPFANLMTVRDGKVARMEMFLRWEEGRRAAGV